MTALLFKHSTSQAYGKKMCTMTDVIFLPFIAHGGSRAIPAGTWINIFKTTGQQAVIKPCKHMLCFPLNLFYLSLCLKHAMCPCYATAAANAVTRSSGPQLSELGPTFLMHFAARPPTFLRQASCKAETCARNPGSLMGCACYKWAWRQRSWSWITNGWALSSQIYLGLLEPVKQITGILQISICSGGKTGSPLPVCVPARACVCGCVCVDVCAWDTCVNKSNNNVCLVSTSI